jgi:hypothetical protein
MSELFSEGTPRISEGQMTIAAIRAIARRYERKFPKQRGPLLLASLRIAQLRRLFRARYRYELPNDNIGREHARAMAHHLAQRPGDPRHQIEKFLEVWAPWMLPAEVQDLIVTVLRMPLKFSADRLATLLALTEVERARLRITTIGAIDLTKAERKARRSKRDRERHREKRRAQGAKPRTEYEAYSISRRKPWEVIGISRATWYRKHSGGAERPLPQIETSASAAFCCLSAVDEPVCACGTAAGLSSEEGLDRFSQKSCTHPIGSVPLPRANALLPPHLSKSGNAKAAREPLPRSAAMEGLRTMKASEILSAAVERHQNRTAVARKRGRPFEKGNPGGGRPKVQGLRNCFYRMCRKRSEI